MRGTLSGRYGVQSESHEDLRSLILTNRSCRHAEEMPHVVERMTKTWQRQSGWVGMCMLGGLDQDGELVGT